MHLQCMYLNFHICFFILIKEISPSFHRKTQWYNQLNIFRDHQIIVTKKPLTQILQKGNRKGILWDSNYEQIKRKQNAAYIMIQTTTKQQALYNHSKVHINVISIFTLYLFESITYTIYDYMATFFTFHSWGEIKIRCWINPIICSKESSHQRQPHI